MKIPPCNHSSASCCPAVFFAFGVAFASRGIPGRGHGSSNVIIRIWCALLRCSVPCCCDSKMDGLTIFGHLPCRFRCGSKVLLLVLGSPRPVLPTPCKWGNSVFPTDNTLPPPTHTLAQAYAQHNTQHKMSRGGGWANGSNTSTAQTPPECRAISPPPALSMLWSGLWGPCLFCLRLGRVS